MNAPHAPSLLATVELAPRDPILGVTEAFVADTNPRKVNLGVGVYVNDEGKVPLLECVHRAEQQLTARSAPHPYLPIDGIAAYDRAVQSLLLGADSNVVREGRAITVQALGGTGGLKVGADFLRRFAPTAQVWISDPSWENHRALFEGAGFIVNAYPYYDAATNGLDFIGMKSTLEKLSPGAIVLLHACCHNPTGVDPTPDQWREILGAVRGRGLIPFLDLAYQGFAEGLAQDGEVVRQFAATPGPLFISNSFSKSFSLYGERVGALTIVAADRDEAMRVLSQVKRVARANYSSPPSFGGQVAATILETPELRSLWERELGDMRERIRRTRQTLYEALVKRVPAGSFHFIVEQRGMFSYTGLTRSQVQRLRDEFSVYALDSGRICVAAVNSRNLEYVADAIAHVIA
jgi:aromatic-amino-acid transaminase